MTVVGETLRETATVLNGVAEAIARLADLHDELEVIAARPALSVLQTAELLSVSTDTVHRRIAAGELPSFTVGGARRIPYSAVESLMSGASQPNRKLAAS